ncbi:MAG: hypothetical protein RLZZ385_1735 [Pseudomonadota bacterium]
MKSMPALLALCLLSIASAQAVSCESGLALEGPCALDTNHLRMNDVQVVGSHNSYKQAIPAAELALIRANNERSAQALDYYHRSLTEQLELGMRQLELDIVYDPRGGFYADPLLPRLAGSTGALVYDTSEMLEPGFKVLHAPDIDVRSHCMTWIACLEEIKAWSDSNPDHVPILIMFNAKEGGSSYPGTISALTFDAAAYDALDAEILSVFPRRQLIIPDDVRGTAPTLREGVLAGGWPSLEQARGRIFFAMDERPAKVEIYLRGRESLEGLPIFVNSVGEDAPHAAYFTINDPIGSQERIRAAVQAGFMVRTRADADTAEARANDTRRREAAFSSGAQYISTDYYHPRPEFSDYQVRLPGGQAARCNPRREACRQALADNNERAWLAGDHHIHSRYSVGWDRTQEPPAPIIGEDAIYPIHMNALMAKYYGLSWMVSTDHGGPNHSRVNRDLAYPELRQSRLVVPEVIQFYGMEFDTPGADHSSLIIPHGPDESTRLFEIESQFSKREPWPENPDWDTEPRMLEALRFMLTQNPRPLVMAHHPSRSATDLGVYRQYSPAEIRDWNDLAPDIAVAMEGSPGHQAGALNPDGSLDPDGARGGYGNYPTHGGFDQFTAIVGGFWDSLLAEGRRWWITANSDSHVHYTEGGSDFWPGEYSKTYVLAERNHDDILDGIRNGRIFVTTGDLVSELHVDVSSAAGSAGIGQTLTLADREAALDISIRFLDPVSPNNHGDVPDVARVDLILGRVSGPAEVRSADRAPDTSVVARFTAADWVTEGDYKVIRYRLENLTGDSYVRVRGTNGNELEPAADPRGEDPWSDLWFYSNPVFIELQ